MTTEQKFKYYLGDKGFKNKRTYHNAIVLSNLSEEGKVKVVDLTKETIEKLQERMTLEEAQKAIHFGFRNTEVKSITHDLTECIETLTIAGRVELITYTFNGPTPFAVKAVTLLRKYLNADAQLIVGKKLVEEENEEVNMNNMPAEYNKAEDGSYGLGNISATATISANPLE